MPGADQHHRQWRRLHRRRLVGGRVGSKEAQCRPEPADRSEQYRDSGDDRLVRSSDTARSECGIKPMGKPTSKVPSPDEIRAQVDRMPASSVFSGSPQLGAFFRFVVESVLAGNSSRIKAYTIGVEVLRRDAKF